MKKPTPIPEKAKSIVHHTSEDGSVELYSLMHEGKTETYLRKGYCTHLVTGDVDLKFTPEPSDSSDFSKNDRAWTQANGLKPVKTPKNF